MNGAGFALLTFVGLMTVAGLLARESLRRSRIQHRLGAGSDESADSSGVRVAGLASRSVYTAAAVGIAVSLLVLLVSGRMSVAFGLGWIAGALGFIAHRTRRDRADLLLEEGLADALTLVNSALRAGASPLDALQRAARDATEPLSSLLSDLAGRLAAGESPADATDRLLEKAPLESFRLLSLCLAVQWSAGSQLSRSLALVSRSVRDRADVLRRVETQAGPTRGSVLVLIAANAAIAAIVWINDPAGTARYLDSEIGTLLVGGTLFLQGISLLWMWRLARTRL